ncbi:MAG: FHA domain-containing protein [Magnetococcus sp. WYHC-3]
MARLLLRFGDLVQREFLLREDPLATHVVGRAATCDILIDNLSISRNHAKIVRKGMHWIVEDLNSVNGTRVNGRRLTQGHVLRVGDLVGIGRHTLEFQDEPVSDDMVAPSPVVVEASVQEVPVPSVQVRGYLRVTAGRHRARHYRLREGITLGRGRAVNIRVRGWWVPGVVAVVHQQEERFQLEPRWGQVRLNGKRLWRTRTLSPGDLLAVGDSEFQFHLRRE